MKRHFTRDGKLKEALAIDAEINNFSGLSLLSLSLLNLLLKAKQSGVIPTIR